MLGDLRVGWRETLLARLWVLYSHDSALRSACARPGPSCFQRFLCSHPRASRLLSPKRSSGDALTKSYRRVTQPLGKKNLQKARPPRDTPSTLAWVVHCLSFPAHRSCAPDWLWPRNSEPDSKRGVEQPRSQQARAIGRLSHPTAQHEVAFDEQQHTQHASLHLVETLPFVPVGRLFRPPLGWIGPLVFRTETRAPVGCAGVHSCSTNIVMIVHGPHQPFHHRAHAHAGGGSAIPGTCPSFPTTSA